MEKRIYAPVLWMFICAMLISGSAAPFAFAQNVVPPAKNAALYFTENIGQIHNVQGKPCAEVLYTLAIQGTNVFYRTKGISYVFRSGDSLYRADLNFAHALTPRVYARDQVSGFSNYYTANGVAESARHYRTLVYENIYQGIDALITIVNGKLKTNFLLHPGASAQSIQLQYQGATLQAQSDGSLLLTTPLGTIHESVPLSYIASSKENALQKSNMPIASEYTTTLSSALPTVGFSIGNYDHQRLAVIDPITTFASYFGGSGSDSSTTAIADGNGIIVCGVTTSSNFPTSPGVFQTTAQGAKDAFVAKFDASGARQWATYLGGSGDDIALGMCKTPNGNYVIVGSTSSQSAFTTSGTLQPNYGGGGTDGFICVLNGTNGGRNSCSYYGGSNNDLCRGVSTDVAGNLFFCGTSQSNNITMSTHQTSYKGGKSDAFLVKASPDLSGRAWSTYYGGFGDETGVGTGVMPDGSVILCGTTTTLRDDIDISDNVTEGLNEFGQIDVFIAKFSSDGKRTWGRYYGGATEDQVTRIFINGNNMYICGYSNSVNTGAEFLATSGTAQNNFAGGAYDGFLVKFSPESGNRVWGTYHGGNGDDRCTNITTAANGDIFLSGMTNSATFPLKFSDQKTNAGGYDAFLGYYTTDGSKRIASVIYGGSGDDIGTGIAWLSDGKVFLSGSTNSSNFPTEGATQNSNAGSFDLFLIKFVDLSILSVDEQTAASALITPNPIRERINIHLSEFATEATPATLRIRDVLGAVVYEVALALNAETQSVDISFLARGSYCIELQSAQKQYRQLMIKD